MRVPASINGRYVYDFQLLECVGLACILEGVMVVLLFYLLEEILFLQD